MRDGFQIFEEREDEKIEQDIQEIRDLLDDEGDLVDDFAHVNERREGYGIDPLRWPKSLAIPEPEQPWLKRPLAELVMREPTEAEYAKLSA